MFGRDLKKFSLKRYLFENTTMMGTFVSTWLSLGAWLFDQTLV